MELEAVDIAAGMPSTFRQASAGRFWAYCGPSSPLHQEITDDQRAGPVGSEATSRLIAPAGGRQKMTTGAGNAMKDLQETYGNRQEGPNGDQETIERRTGGMANQREMSMCQGKRGDTGMMPYF
jgi:hypothetical protein